MKRSRFNNNRNKQQNKFRQTFIYQGTNVPLTRGGRRVY